MMIFIRNVLIRDGIWTNLMILANFFKFFGRWWLALYWKNFLPRRSCVLRHLVSTGQMKSVSVVKVCFHYIKRAKLKSDLFDFYFDCAGFQTWIGQVDVKSSPVYFYVQRYNDFNAINNPIPFDTERLNVGEVHGATGWNLFIFIHRTSSRVFIFIYSSFCKNVFER